MIKICEYKVLMNKRIQGILSTKGITTITYQGKLCKPLVCL